LTSRPLLLPTLFPYTTLFRSALAYSFAFPLWPSPLGLQSRTVSFPSCGSPFTCQDRATSVTLIPWEVNHVGTTSQHVGNHPRRRDRKSTRLNSTHEWISYAVF